MSNAQVVKEQRVETRRPRASGRRKWLRFATRPDQGIAQDHPAYLQQSRDKLRRYMLEYVVKREEK